MYDGEGIPDAGILTNCPWKIGRANSQRLIVVKWAIYSPPAIDLDQEEYRRSQEQEQCRRQSISVEEIAFPPRSRIVREELVRVAVGPTCEEVSKGHYYVRSTQPR